ncbi:biotin-dependent carboxyltransferase family protein [Nonomuraea dietziae]|uniref:5-oxoprolinase subunit C family protein n=1 Tax=Nonomuraea dietziae TaxID=65515 RepID=UPI003CD0A0CA
MGAPFWIAPGHELRIGSPERGLRTYLAVRGGIDVEPVLGSRSTDSLSGLGPAPASRGHAAARGRGAVARLDLGRPGSSRPLPRRRCCACWPALVTTGSPPTRWPSCARGPYEVSQDSNRVGVRLRGAQSAPALRRVREGELPSEGMVTGAVQVPPSGQPIVFLTDHPPTGGYPVIGVVLAARPGRGRAGQAGRPDQVQGRGALKAGPRPAPWPGSAFAGQHPPHPLDGAPQRLLGELLEQLQRDLAVLALPDARHPALVDHHG